MSANQRTPIEPVKYGAGTLGKRWVTVEKRPALNEEDLDILVSILATMDIQGVEIAGKPCYIVNVGAGPLIDAIL